MAASRISVTQPESLEAQQQHAQQGGVGGDGRSGVEVTVVGGPAERGRRLAYSASTQSKATRWRGPTQMSQ